MPHPSKAKEKADKNLEEWDDFCKGLNIKHFLVFGTCLGMVREKAYIENDGDMDVGVICSGEDFSKLVQKLLQNGFVNPAGWQREKQFFRYGIMLDVHRVPPDHPQKKLFMVSLDEVSYNGRIYKTPHPVEKYLEYLYGNWKIKSRKNPMHGDI